MSDVLVCLPIVSGKLPPVVSYRSVCQQCGCLVWRAFSSPIEAETTCVPCVLKMIAKEDLIEVMPPSAEQLKEIASHVESSNN